MYKKPVIFVVISVWTVMLVHSSFSTFYVFAVPPAQPAGTDCSTGSDSKGNLVRTCCWNDAGGPPALRNFVCQDCRLDGKGGWNVCGNKYPDPSPTRGGEGIVAPLEEGVLEQPPTPPPGPAAPLQDGGVLQQPPTQGVAPPVTRGQGVSPQDGALQQPPADQGATELPPPPATEETQPAAEQPVPVCQEGLEFNEGLGFCVPTECPEGQELNEETGICVLEEQPAAAQEPEEQQQTGEEQPQPEEEQPSQESDSEEDNNNN